MSRVARMPVVLPAGVDFNLAGDMITVKGLLVKMVQPLRLARPMILVKHLR
jgi:ribosomal protein L6P/L9E